MPVPEGVSPVDLTISGEQFVVFDHVLDSRALDAARAAAVKLCYTRHSTTVLHPVWRREDGGQLIGPRFGLTGQPPVSSLSPDFAEALAELAVQPDVRRLIGEQGTDWQTTSVTPWVYPQGTLLSMHDDGGSVAGAFVFYIHEQWPIRWGGWLAIMHASEDDMLDLAVSEDRAREEGSADYSYGDLIIPVPNRLVVLSPRAKHLISRVDFTAGDRLRMSLNGIFHYTTGG